jgi:hypothetical protein
LAHAAKAISALGEEEFTSEKRKQWLDDRRKTAALEEVSHCHLWNKVFTLTDILSLIPHTILDSFTSQLTDEHIVSTGRKYMESRKKMLEQLGKGMTRAQASIAKSAAGVPAGSSN